MDLKLDFSSQIVCETTNVFEISKPYIDSVFISYTNVEVNCEMHISLDTIASSSYISKFFLKEVLFVSL